VTLTVRERAETVATLRHIEITLMETLARWVPTTPMMEVKVLFGRHIWITAQHADMLGKRTYELRAPMHLTLAPTADYAAFLADLAAVKPQAERLSAFYDVAIPAVVERCRAYLAATDPLLDEPTVRIFERIVQESGTMIAEANALRGQHASLQFGGSGVIALAARERSIETFVAGWNRTHAETANA
jgi:hypothetical protein